jgi:hypothetical protein
MLQESHVPVVSRRERGFPVTGSRVARVQWFFTGLLVAVSAGIAGYTGWLLRRLFTTEPPEASS